MVICGVHSAGGVDRLGRWPGAQLGHGLFQHVVVELEADLADLARLLVAQEVAGTADVEVVAGELEARPQALQRLDHADRRRSAVSASALLAGTVK